jgi:hypothetical protein
MPPINRIELRIITGDRVNAGTDGAVFLGTAGREFNVDSQGDVNDFERNSDRTYIFGEGATVQRPQENDPRSPWQTDSDDLSVNPIYIRFEPGDGGDWNLELVVLTVITVDATESFEFHRLEGRANLWLGESRGKFLFLRPGPTSK